MNILKTVFVIVIIILICPNQSFAISNSQTLPGLNLQNTYYLESDNINLNQISELRDGQKIDLDNRDANLYFLNQNYYGLNIGDNLEIGRFNYNEYYINAEQGLVDFFFKVRERNISEGRYILKGNIDTLNLQGYYLGKRFKINEDTLLNLRLKYINSGHLEKSKYDGIARMSDNFIYQSGYRQVVISRDKNYQPGGISLDIKGETIIKDNLLISFSAENLYSYIIFKNLYFREMFDRTGSFYYDDTAIKITPVYMVDFNYKDLIFGVSYINRYEPYFGYSFKSGKDNLIPVDIDFTLHRNKYGVKLSPDWNLADISIEVVTDRINLRKAKNINLSFLFSF